MRNSLDALLEQNARAILDERWGAMQSLLRIESVGDRHRAIWYFDLDDSEEATTVTQIKSMFMLADQHGQLIEASPAYQAINRDTANDITARLKEILQGGKTTLWLLRRSDRGKPFLIRAGLVYCKSDLQPFYAAIGVPVRWEEELQLTLASTITLTALVCLLVALLVSSWHRHVGS